MMIRLNDFIYEKAVNNKALQIAINEMDKEKLLHIIDVNYYKEDQIVYEPVNFGLLISKLK